MLNFKKAYVLNPLIILVFIFCSLAHAKVNVSPIKSPFGLSAKIIDPNTVRVTFKITPGYYLYKDRIHLKVSGNSELGRLQLPEASTKRDSEGKTYSVYQNKLDFPVWLLNDKPGKATLTVYYQGCSKSGFCYPPKECSIELTIDNSLSLSHLSWSKPSIKKTAIAKKIINKAQANIESLYGEKNLLLLMLGFFGLGLLLSFTPCVLPMVPVLSGIIVGQKESVTTKKAFLLSLVYVLSMALTYALMGIFFAYLGKNLQVYLQKPFFIASASSIFILLALSMFGILELKLPQSLSHKLHQLSHNKRKKHVYLGTAFMGVVATLILSPCVTAPLVGAFGYIASTGDVILGGLSLFSLGLGMGAPLILIGTSAGGLLPKAGSWMQNIKYFFGYMLLLVALYMLERIIPAPLTMLLTALLLITFALSLGTFKKTSGDMLQLLAKALGTITFTYGLLILIGLSQGSTNVFYPLKPLSNQKTSDLTAKKQVVTTLSELKTAIKKAKGHYVLIDYYANWCTSCKIMESRLFTDDDIKTALHSLVLIKADVSDNSNDSIAMEQKFNVIAPPTLIFLDKSGHEVSRLVGEVNKTMLLKAVTELSRP